MTEAQGHGGAAVKGTLCVACLQLSPGNDIAENIETLVRLGELAVRQGAQFIAAPEYCFKLDGRGRVMAEDAYEEAGHPGILAMCAFARQHMVWFVIGAAVVKLASGGLVCRSILVAPDGSIASRYDKLHMFDVVLADGRKVFESRRYEPGSVARVVETDFGVVGLSICYDLRFARLFHELARAGADIVILPAAFYPATGAKHWHVLVRARAIETGAYIIAPATCGEHPGGHATYGHSLIVAPSGEILLDAGEEEGVWTCLLDLDAVARTRQAMPSLRHARDFEVKRDVVRSGTRP